MLALLGLSAAWSMAAVAVAVVAVVSVIVVVAVVLPAQEQAKAADAKAKGLNEVEMKGVNSQNVLSRLFRQQIADDSVQLVSGGININGSALTLPSNTISRYTFTGVKKDDNTDLGAPLVVEWRRNAFYVISPKIQISSVRFYFPDPRPSPVSLPPNYMQFRMVSGGQVEDNKLYINGNPVVLSSDGSLSFTLVTAAGQTLSNYTFEQRAGVLRNKTEASLGSGVTYTFYLNDPVPGATLMPTNKIEFSIGGGSSSSSSSQSLGSTSMSSQFVNGVLDMKGSKDASIALVKGSVFDAKNMVYNPSNVPGGAGGLQSWGIDDQFGQVGGGNRIGEQFRLAGKTINSDLKMADGQSIINILVTSAGGSSNGAMLKIERLSSTALRMTIANGGDSQSFTFDPTK